MYVVRTDISNQSPRDTGKCRNHMKGQMGAIHLGHYSSAFFFNYFNRRPKLLLARLNTELHKG